MKTKKILFVAFVLLAIVFTSCRKNYTCQCTYVDPYSSQTIVDNYEISKTRKVLATTICEDRELTWYYLDPTANCVLK